MQAGARADALIHAGWLVLLSSQRMLHANSTQTAAQPLSERPEPELEASSHSAWCLKALTEQGEGRCRAGAGSSRRIGDEAWAPVRHDNVGNKSRYLAPGLAVRVTLSCL